MAKRIFISFAIEDRALRDFLVGQAKNKKSPFEFVDMSVKQPCSSSWKTRCRNKIRGCHGVLTIVTKNTRNAAGQLWEIACSTQEAVPQRGLWGNSNDKPNTLPKELETVRITAWTWENIKNWINSL